MVFRNREEAAILLERKLRDYEGRKDAIILAIPRGGVVVGHYISKHLKIPMDIIITKKIPHPENEEVAIGAVGADVAYIDKDALVEYGIPQEYVDESVRETKNSIKFRYERYRKGTPQQKLTNKTVILIDDGIATGHTIIAAIKSIKKQKPKKIIIATPVGHPGTIKQLKKMVDEVVCLTTPDNFVAIGQFYSEFEQLNDQQAMDYLKTSYVKNKKK